MSFAIIFAKEISLASYKVIYCSLFSERNKFIKFGVLYSEIVIAIVNFSYCMCVKCGHEINCKTEARATNYMHESSRFGMCC